MWWFIYAICIPKSPKTKTNMWMCINQMMGKLNWKICSATNIRCGKHKITTTEKRNSKSNGYGKSLAYCHYTHFAWWYLRGHQQHINISFLIIIFIIINTYFTQRNSNTHAQHTQPPAFPFHSILCYAIPAQAQWMWWANRNVFFHPTGTTTTWWYGWHGIHT